MGAVLSESIALMREHMHKNIVDIYFEADKTTTPVMADMETKAMDGEGFGRGYMIPIEYGTGSSASPSFTVAQAKAQGSTTGSSALRERWEVQAAKIEVVAYWDRDSMLATEGRGVKETFKVLDREMKAKVALCKKRLSHIAVERGYGRVGTITAITSTTATINTSLINRVDVGDDLVGAAAEASGAMRDSGDTNDVTGYDPDTGIITFGTNPDTDWDVGDVLFHEGYREATGASYNVPVGLLGWIPAAAPTDTFMGVPRTGNPNLQGHRVACNGRSHAATLIALVNRLHKYGVKVSAIKCSAEDYAVLCADKDATKNVEITLGKYNVGFDGVTVSTLAGRVPVVADAMIEQGYAWAGAFDQPDFAPFLAHNGDLVNVDDLDGNTIRAAASSTNLEMRMYFRGAIAVPAPGKFGIATGLLAA